MKNEKLDQSKLLGFKILPSNVLEKNTVQVQANTKLGAKIGSKENPNSQHLRITKA